MPCCFPVLFYFSTELYNKSWFTSPLQRTPLGKATSLKENEDNLHESALETMTASTSCLCLACGLYCRLRVHGSCCQHCGHSLSTTWAKVFQKGRTLDGTKYTQPGTGHQGPSFLRTVSVQGKELEEFSVVKDLNKKMSLDSSPLSA